MTDCTNCYHHSVCAFKQSRYVNGALEPEDCTDFKDNNLTFNVICKPGQDVWVWIDEDEMYVKKTVSEIGFRRNSKVIVFTDYTQFTVWADTPDDLIGRTIKTDDPNQ